MKLSPRHLATAALLAVAACTVNLEFEMTREVSVASAGTALSAQSQIDISAYQAIKDHQDKIQSLTLKRVVMTVDEVSAGQGATVSGARLALTAGSQTYRYTVATQPSPVAFTAGATATLTGFDPVDGARPLGDVMLDVAKSGATFTAAVEGTLSAPVTAKLTVKLVADMEYGTP